MSTTMSSMREERTISDVRRICRAGLEATTLLQRVARALQRAIPFDIYSAATIDPASSLITSAFGELLSGAEGARPANPIWFEHFYFGETYEKTQDLLHRNQWATSLAIETRGKLDASFCYRESMQPAGIEHKAHVIFVDRNLWGDMELYRAAGEPAFSSEELALLHRIAPDVASGLKFAALRGQAQAGSGATAATMPGVLIVDVQGHGAGTPAAEQLLADLSGTQQAWRSGDRVPIPVQVVLGALDRSLRETGAKPNLRARGQSGRWLALHAAYTEATDQRPAERMVVISPAPPEDLVWLGMTAYDLSAREEEVVTLVLGGLATKQISERLFIAEHTVQRHLSNIFEKVGVRSRRDLVKQLFFEHLLPRTG